MAMTVENMEQLTRNIFVESGDMTQPQIQAALMSCTYRKDRHVSVSIEIINKAACDQQPQDVANAVQAFLADAFARARAAGLPVPSEAPSAQAAQ